MADIIPLTNEQLTERVQSLEEKFNEIQTALNNLATKKQLKSLLNIRQTEIIDLQERMTSVESQIKLLQI